MFALMNQAMNHRAVRDESSSPDLAYEGMTPKQWNYAHERAAGHNQTEAYRRAYPGQNMTDKQIGQTAADLERDPRVAGKIRRLLVAKGQQSNLVPVVERIEVSKDWVVQGIARLAANEQIKANTRLAAYIAVGKSAGVDAFRDIVVHEKRTRTIDEIDAEIARHLANMIDVTPNQIPVKTLDAEPVNREPVNTGAKDRRRKPTPG